MKRFILVLLTLALFLASCAENTFDTTSDTAVKDTAASPDESGNGVTESVPDAVTDNFQAENSETTFPQTEAEIAVPTPDFVSDLSEYEMYMAPTGDARDAYLILVNSKNPLSEDFVPEGLVDVKDTRDDGRKTQQMCLYAEKALEAFLIEARANGCKNVTVTSAYRDYAYQKKLFNTYINNEMNDHPSWTREEAEKEVRTYSAVAGTSEHQTGLACDMHNLSSAKQKFGNTFEGKWLAENAWKFGFILRYAEDKMDITGGIIYEPWHFRYVGRQHAKYMYDNNLCLEEYLDYLNNK